MDIPPNCDVECGVSLPQSLESLPNLGRGMRTGMARRRADRDKPCHSIQSCAHRRADQDEQFHSFLYSKKERTIDNCSRRQDDHSTIEPTATLHGKPWNRSLRAIYETLPVTRHVLLFFLFLVKDYEHQRDCRKEKSQPYEGASNEMEQGRTTTTIPQKR